MRPDRKPSSFSDAISASEIASFAYCPEQWRLQYGLGHASENVAFLKQGEGLHAKTASVEVSSRGVFRLSWVLILLASVLGLFSFWLGR
jgi:hypothetical protein